MSQRCDTTVFDDELHHLSAGTMLFKINFTREWRPVRVYLSLSTVPSLHLVNINVNQLPWSSVSMLTQRAKAKQCLTTGQLLLPVITINCRCEFMESTLSENLLKATYTAQEPDRASNTVSLKLKVRVTCTHGVLRPQVSLAQTFVVKVILFG